MGYQGIYPVHPREKELLGLRAYPGIKEIPVDIDLAISLVPRTEALKVVQECAEKGVKGMLLFTSGFKEKDAEGGKIEQEIVLAARKAASDSSGRTQTAFIVPQLNLYFPRRFNGRGLPAEAEARPSFPERLIR